MEPNTNSKENRRWLIIWPTRTLKLPTAVVISVIAGCANTPHQNNLTPIYLIDAPVVKTYSDPGVNFSRYSTFTVATPASLLGKTAEAANEIETKQMLFALRNRVEAQGYRFVHEVKDADLIFTSDGSSTYRETYVPPRQVSAPKWIPGQTITNVTRSSGNSTASAVGTVGSANAYGTSNGSSRSTTYVPGYMTTTTVTQPGYALAFYYPSVSVTAVEAKTGTVIWAGNGVGTSKNSDYRIASQTVLGKITVQLPSKNIAPPIGIGIVGVNIVSLTVDGNNYYPAVAHLYPKFPADNAGLRYGDLIVGIDGKGTVNQPLVDLYSWISGPIGTSVHLSIRRMEKELQFDLTRRAQPSPTK